MSIEFARKLRKSPTNEERAVWRWLRDRRLTHEKFRRQFPFGPYVIDFFCFDLRLAIELDGAFHISEEAHEYDVRRDAYLTRHGITVVRFWNDDIREHPECCADKIIAEIERLKNAPHPAFGPPSPAGRGL